MPSTSLTPEELASLGMLSGKENAKKKLSVKEIRERKKSFLVRSSTLPELGELELSGGLHFTPAVLNLSGSQKSL